ncbi:MAG: hypothetical protein AVDCRST_MAG57-138, partial [uncultured Blastococcus sp.]
GRRRRCTRRAMSCSHPRSTRDRTDGRPRRAPAGPLADPLPPAAGILGRLL